MVKVFEKKKRSRKIDEKTRLKIVKLYGTGKFSQKELAERFGCTQPHICCILRASRVTAPNFQVSPVE